MQFLNNWAQMQPTYVLMQFSQKHEQASTISRFKQCPNFLHQLLKTTDLNTHDFATVHDSPSTEAGPTGDGELSDILSWRATIKLGYNMRLLYRVYAMGNKFPLQCNFLAFCS